MGVLGLDGVGVEDAGESPDEVVGVERGAGDVTEGTPMDDHRASSRYRTAMLRSSLERFFAEQLGASGPGMIRTEAGR
ncbi:hypothetical protein DN539_32685 [Burkholderia multivorans]|nr:hypothetical protein DN539_32685 [Burkholderia multivorans]